MYTVIDSEISSHSYRYHVIGYVLNKLTSLSSRKCSVESPVGRPIGGRQPLFLVINFKFVRTIRKLSYVECAIWRSKASRKRCKCYQTIEPSSTSFSSKVETDVFSKRNEMVPPGTSRTDSGCVPSSIAVMLPRSTADKSESSLDFGCPRSSLSSLTLGSTR
jgi:hypothetical protein